MWGIFGKSGNNIEYNPFQVDIHSHLLPGLDDGVQSMEESLEILRQLQTYGFKKIITTPHVMNDYFDNSNDKIISTLHELREAARTDGLTIQVDAAAEYYLDETLVHRLETKDPLLTFGQEKYLLFETSFMNEPVFLKEAIFMMNTSGYVPVLAHPERYLYLFDRIDLLKSIQEMNVHLQLNLLSLTGYYSARVKRFARKLVDAGSIRFIGSDCHNLAQLKSYTRGLNKKVLKNLENRYVLNNTLL
jgi:tyrosine-protein phosphatase YwqE